MCKSRATHQALIICNMSCRLPLVLRDGPAIEFDRVEMAFILALFYWLKPLTNEGGEEAGVPGNKLQKQQAIKTKQKRKHSQLKKNK